MVYFKYLLKSQRANLNKVSLSHTYCPAAQLNIPPQIHIYCMNVDVRSLSSTQCVQDHWRKVERISEFWVCSCYQAKPAYSSSGAGRLNLFTLHETFFLKSLWSQMNLKLFTLNVLLHHCVSCKCFLWSSLSSIVELKRSRICPLMQHQQIFGSGISNLEKKPFIQSCKSSLSWSG